MNSRVRDGRGEKKMCTYEMSENEMLCFRVHGSLSMKDSGKRKGE